MKKATNSIVSLNAQSLIQREDGGFYENTDKNDAHHMPSARAIAAIIMINREKNANQEHTSAEKYKTLSVGKIYSHAPAVWMPHEQHKKTRTYGVNSTNALSEDLAEIKDNSPEDAFNLIQEKDKNDCLSILPVSNKTKSGIKEIGIASTLTIRNINTAIKDTSKKVTAERDSDRETVKTEGLQIIVKELCNKYRSYEKIIAAMKDAKIKECSVGTLENIRYLRTVHTSKNIADRLRFLFDQHQVSSSVHADL